MVWKFIPNRVRFHSFRSLVVIAITLLSVIYPANFTSAQVHVLHEGSPLSGFSSLDISPDGLTLYMGDAFGDAVYRMPSAGGTSPVKISVDPLGSTAGLAISPDGSKVFATLALRGLAPSVVFLPSTGGPTTILTTLSTRPDGLAVSPDGGILYIAGLFTQALFQMPSSGGPLTNLFAGSFNDYPTDVDVSSDGNTIYFSASRFDQIYKVPANGGTPQSISTGINFVDPVSVAHSADGSTLFVLDSNIRIDASGHVVTTGGFPGAIFVGPPAGGAFSLLVAGGADYGLQGKIALSPDGSTLYFGGVRRSNGAAVILSISTGPDNQPPAVAANQATVMANEGQTTTNTGTVNDPDGDAVNLNASVGSVTNNGNGTWSWSFTTSDGPAQSQTVTISADDGNGGTAQTSFSLTVNNVAPSVDAITVPINPLDISNQPISVSATFSDPAGTHDEPYTCTIDFGDGSGPQAGTVSGMTCSSSHTYPSAGNYVVTVYVTDKDDGSGSAVAEQPIVITENQSPVAGANQAMVVADEGQTTTNTGTVNDPDGDAVNLNASVGSVTNNGNGTWSWSFTTSDGPAQSQTVTISADDGNGGTAQTSFSLTVNNVAPTVNAVTVPLNPIDIANQPVSVSATFSDPAGTHDEPYTCTIDFGDGTGPQAGTVSGMACSGSHTYANAGVYVVTVTVTDKDNDSGSASASNFVVIYDPSAGHVTGGGWIDSPSGAYVPDPTLTGKANFGFVSKYQKGKSTPEGNTTFHFNTAGFKFKSTSYEWLVIAGAKAQYKGEGVVNNNGNYGFMLFATDGQINGGGGLDKFRIKIWDKSNGDVVVYDNQMGDADDGEASDAIEGGSIVVHGGGAGKAAADKETASVPQEYALAQNYPNPFNPATTFAFDLPRDSQVKLTVYSLTGQVVATVANNALNAGHHTFVWQVPADLPSGTYLYKLETPEFISTKKLVFMK